jgi:transketolase
MRKMLADTLIEIATYSNEIIFLTGDLGFGVFDDFKKQFPEKYINVGIAESALVSVAAGLSSVGYTPVVYSIASFMTARPYEQIRFLVGYNEFPIIIIGAGGGLSYGMSGSSHLAVDDLGLMSLIPNLRVAAPAGPLEMKTVLTESVNLKKSIYIQIGKFGEKDLSRFNSIDDGEILILSTGSVSHEVAVAQNYLLDSKVKLDFMHLTYPFELNWQLEKLNLTSYKHIIVVEDHIPQGGLHGSALSYFNDKNINRKIHRLGLPNSFIHDYFDQDKIRKLFGYDSFGIVNKIQELLKS